MKSSMDTVRFIVGILLILLSSHAITAGVIQNNKIFVSYVLMLLYGWHLVTRATIHNMYYLKQNCHDEIQIMNDSTGDSDNKIIVFHFK